MKKFFTICAAASLLLCGCSSESESISDAEITDLLDKYNEIIMLTEYESPVFDSESSVQKNDMTYYRVTDESIDTWEEWTDKVNAVCSPALAEAVLSDSSLINIDGAAYTSGGSKGSDRSAEYTYEKTAENEAIVKTSSISSDDIYENTAIFEHTENGWRISSY